MAQLAQSLGLDLPDAFPGHVELLSQLFQGAGLPVLQPEAQSQHPFLPGCQASLTPREERVLTLRFGLEDGQARTLEELGKEFNVTRERIRQIEAKALRKLRHPSRAKRLRDYLEE